MVSLTDFISFSVDSVTLSYHSWSLVLAESFVRLLFLNMPLSRLMMPYASFNFGYMSNNNFARPSWPSVHLSRLLSICFLHLVRLSTLVSSLLRVDGMKRVERRIGFASTLLSFGTLVRLAVCLSLFGQPFQLLPELGLFLLLFLDRFALQSQPYLLNAFPAALDDMKTVAYDHGVGECGLRYGPHAVGQVHCYICDFQPHVFGQQHQFLDDSDGFVPFIIAMTVCFPPCPSLLWRMVYTSWQNDVSSKPKWTPMFSGSSTQSEAWSRCGHDRKSLSTSL